DEAALRRRAEARLRAGERAKPLSVADARRMAHELEVHQIELEMQNEELRAARAELEAGLARYRELFDFAPIGYVSLAADGTVREANHAAALVLCVERARLIGSDFGLWIAAKDRATVIALLERARDSEAKEVCEADLGNGATGIDARLTATAIAGPSPMLL